MMKIIFIMALFLIGTQDSFAQISSKSSKIKGYKVRVMFLDDREPIRGYLYNATDSSIIIIPTNSKYEIEVTGSRLEIPIKEINKIKKSVKKAALIGAIPGFVGGAILGGVAGTYSGNDATIIGAGLLMGAIGGSITSGITTAFASKVYRINGDLEIYKAKFMFILQEKSMTINRITEQ